MASLSGHAIGGGLEQPAAVLVLGSVARAARARRRADWRYKAALVGAVDELERAGVADPFARVAAAAGVSRQAARELVGRARAEGS